MQYYLFTSVTAETFQMETFGKALVWFLIVISVCKYRGFYLELIPHFSPFHLRAATKTKQRCCEHSDIFLRLNTNYTIKKRRYEVEFLVKTTTVLSLTC